MRVGLHIGRFHWPGGPASIGPTLLEIARAVDDGAFASLWLMDHLFQLGEEYGAIHGPVDAPMLEGYCTLGYLAAATRRIRLGLLVTCPSYRHPGVLIKTVSTLDVLSGGRAFLGLGAGWFTREAVGLGIPFPSLGERYERLAETLQIARHMWTGDTGIYRGKYYQLDEPLNVPLPITSPHPPIVIGGGGEKRTLRLVARYADACNLVLRSPSANMDFGQQRARSTRPVDVEFEVRQTVGRKLGVLAEHCRAIGRPYEQIEKTVVTYIKTGQGGMEPREIVDYCAILADLGVGHIIFNVLEAHTIRPLEVIAERVIPVVREF